MSKSYLHLFYLNITFVSVTHFHFIMVKFEFLAASAFALGALAHPTIKHIGSEKRFCANEPAENIFARDLSSRATIPKATTWNPPSSMVKALDEVWKQTLKENPDGLKDKNWITDQLMANNGTINYCVRWNTDAHKSTAADRTKITLALQRSLQKWFDILVGFEGFPLTKLTVKTVGYAVKNKSVLEGSTDGLDIYTTADADGVPECDVRCYRGAHLDDPNGISSCPGGEDSRYDISLWLDKSLDQGGDTGGYGYNWGEVSHSRYR